MSDTPDDTSPPRRLASTSTTEPQDATEVARLRARQKVTTGKPKRLPKTAGMKLAYGTMSTSGTTSSAGGNFYSPELSTDFLELPQSLYEQWNYYRFFYRKNPFVGQALDLHTELPLSKVRLNIPKAKNRELALQATEWCERWARRIGLLHRLLSMVHEWHLIGEVFVWCEDANPEMPEDLMYEEVNVIEDGDDGTGEAKTVRRRREDQSAAVAWLKKNYKGWTAIRCLPPEQTHMEAFNFTDEKLIELVPDSKTKKIIEAADSGDTRAQRIVESMPTDIVDAVRNGANIPLNTDPEAGSFVHYLANKKSDYEPRGHSVLERCLQSLVHYDKLRQANASIASRHMTPIRIVYAEDMAASDTDALREQVDLALQDPDFSIIANFQITWEEMGSDSRLLDLSGEMDLLARELYAGLGHRGPTDRRVVLLGRQDQPRGHQHPVHVAPRDPAGLHGGVPVQADVQADGVRRDRRRRQRTGRVPPPVVHAPRAARQRGHVRLAVQSVPEGQPGHRRHPRAAEHRPRDDAREARARLLHAERLDLQRGPPQHVRGRRAQARRGDRRRRQGRQEPRPQVRAPEGGGRRAVLTPRQGAVVRTVARAASSAFAVTIAARATATACLHGPAARPRCAASGQEHFHARRGLWMTRTR